MPLKQRFARIKNLIDTNHGTHRGLIRWLLGQLEGRAGAAPSGGMSEDDVEDLPEYIHKYFNDNPSHFDPRQYLKPARDAIKAMVEHKITTVLGCEGKA